VIVLLTRGADSRAVRTSLVKTLGVTRRRGRPRTGPIPVVAATAFGDEPCRTLGRLAGGRREPSQKRVRRAGDPGALQPRAASGDSDSPTSGEAEGETSGAASNSTISPPCPRAPEPNRTKGTTSARPVAIRSDVPACGLSAIRFPTTEAKGTP
jgi:hypothetical protein